MVKISKQIHGIPMFTVWFAEEPVKDKGIIVYKEAEKEFKGSEPFDTLISDLTESKEEIQAHFAKNCKYKINRAARENVEIVLLKNDEINNEELEAFLVFFDQFWKSKGVDTVDIDLLREEMKAYREAGALSISKAIIDAETVVYHTHLCDEKRARLLHSASLFRLSEDEDSGRKNLIGMANRLLHREDMYFFKDNGLAVYDWGGAGKGEDVKSITEFKESFGGEHVVFHSGIRKNGFKACIVSFLSKIKQGISELAKR